MSEELEVTTAVYLPFHPELGDHRPVVVNRNPTIRSVGQNPKKKK